MSTDPATSVDAVLAIRAADGRYLARWVGGSPALPRLPFQMQYPPMNSELTDRVRVELGLDTIVLEPVDFTTVVLEAGPTSGSCPSDYGWVSAEHLLGQQPALDLWLTRTEPPRASWFTPGWFGRAEQFIRWELGSIGRRPAGPLRQVKHWSMSAVLRCRVDTGGDVYLKAVSPELAREPAVTTYLGSLGVGPFTQILVTSETDGWWLAEDFRGTEAEMVPLDRRVDCIRQVARIQRATIGRTEELRARGAICLDPATLAGRITELLARNDLWAAPEKPSNRNRGLSDDERARLRALGPRLQADLVALTALDLPQTVVHRDLHLGNAVIREDGILVHDWSFATVSFPLLDLGSWLHDATEEEARCYVDAYVDEWSDEIDPRIVREAWRLGKPLAAVAEMLKLVDLADAVGPYHEFSWLPMIYGWCRRLLNAAADVDLETQAWRM
ncbi:aminoglycoside phosphotransferase family protein [Promicromonospora sp. Populi]|uniref:aminoglycoside phosphotransferase family protein n=1 Tax=Promicromonospora sp. Populi TaxID=3239420 RepID=UPI0034E29F33